MLVVALVGLVVNAISAVILLRSERESLNIEAALRHVVADLLGSVGVLIAAVVILLTGWTVVDPIVSLAIACLIVASAWGCFATRPRSSWRRRPRRSTRTPSRGRSFPCPA